MTRYAPQWLQTTPAGYAAAVDRRLIGALWPTAAATGCAVTVATAMTLNVAAGQVAVPTSNGTGSLLCSSDAVEQVTLAAAPASGLNRIDLVVCQARGNDVDGGSNNDFLFAAVTGTAAASPVAPAVPANAVALAQILVPGGSAQVTAANITDRRPPSLAAGAGQGGVPGGRLFPTLQTIIPSSVPPASATVVELGNADALYGGFTRTTAAGNANSGLVVPTPGLYLVSCQVAFQLSGGQVPASQSTFAYIYRTPAGGSPAILRQWSQGQNWASWLQVGGADAARLSAGDVLDLRAQQSTGAPAGTFTESLRTYLSAVLLSSGP